MGCSASKDGVETNRRSRSGARTGGSMSMPVQAQGSSDNGYHMVALTSSTYGILKVASPKSDGKDYYSVSNSNSSSHDAFYEKLKNFDVPEDMVAKPWSEVSRNLPKIPPPTRTDSPRRTDALQQMGSLRGMDSPRQTGRSFRRTDSPRQLPSKATRNETINMWELMDGLEEDGTAKPKPVERIIGSPMLKTFERSVTFSTIHTLSELDSRDPSMAIASGPAGNFLSSSKSVDGGKENAKPVRVMPTSASSPIVRKRDEITVRLTPSSPVPAPRIDTPRSDSARFRHPTVAPMMLTPEANASIQEVSNAVSKALLPPPSPLVRAVSTKVSRDSPTVARPRQPTVTPMTLTPEVNASIQEVSNAVSKALLPPPSPLVRAVSTKVSRDSPTVARPRQPTVTPMTLTPKVNASIQEVSNADSKALLPLPSPGGRSVGTKNASATQARNKPPGFQQSKSPMLKVNNPSIPLNTKLEAEIERAISEDRGVSLERVQLTAIPSSEPGVESNRHSGRVRAVAASLSQDVAIACPQPTPRRVEGTETSNQSTRPVPRFGTPMHVLSLAASFEIENHKNSITQLDQKAPPMSPDSTTTKAGGAGQRGRKLISKQQSMPSPSLRAIPSQAQESGLQSQASFPNPSSYGNFNALNASVGVQKGIQLPENDLSSSYVHVLSDEKPRRSREIVASPSIKGFLKGSMSVAQVCEGISERNASTNTKGSLLMDGIEESALDTDLLASFEEALEMFSADEWYNVRDSKGEATSASRSSDRLEEGVSGDNGRQGIGNKGANAPKATASQKRVKPDPWARFERKCPPAGDDRVVLYTTSLRGIRKTFEDCNNARFIFESFNVVIDERDVSIHAEFRQELKDLAEKPVPVPQAFIKGHYIGGMDMITQLHEEGTLAHLVDGLPPQLSRGECDGCGGVRFVPCSDCCGSTKVVNEANEVVRCSECNENGLMRCPICY